MWEGMVLGPPSGVSLGITYDEMRIKDLKKCKILSVKRDEILGDFCGLYTCACCCKYTCVDRNVCILWI